MRDIARIQEDGNAWGVNDLAQDMSGADPLGAIASRVAQPFYIIYVGKQIGFSGDVVGSLSLAFLGAGYYSAEIYADGPNAATNATGRLFFDRAYVINWATTWRAPHDLRVGVVARYQDGQPFARVVIVPGLTQGAIAALLVHASPELKRVEFHGIPFFAVSPRAPLSPREETTSY